MTVVAAAMPAQEPGAPPEIVQPLPSPATAGGRYFHLVTPDGSRFLLVPTGGVPVVHWAMLTPAGAGEDPPGLEGLSFAVARAALSGTSPRQSTDAVAEPDILAAQDRFEQAWAELRARGETGTEVQLQQLLAARAAATALADRNAWRRDLLGAPATDVRLTELPDAVLLHVDCSLTGLLRVARLIMERRDGSVLRGLHSEFRAVRSELAAARNLGPRAEMRREVLGLSFLGHPVARSFASTHEPRPLAREQALNVYRNTQHPQRTLHVLTGGFDSGAVSAMLSGLFARTSSQPPAPPTPAPGATSPSARKSVIPGGHAPAVTIGFRLPDDVDRDTLAVLVRWLTGGRDSELAQRLRDKGHPEAIVVGTAPFFGKSGMLALLEFEEPERTDKSDSQKLLENVEACLDEVMAAAPNTRPIERALAHVRSTRADARIGAARLASHIAIACGIEGRHPEAVLGAPDVTVTIADVHRLAQTLFAPARRAVVRLEVTP